MFDLVSLTKFIKSIERTRVQEWSDDVPRFGRAEQFRARVHQRNPRLQLHWSPDPLNESSWSVAVGLWGCVARENQNWKRVREMLGWQCRIKISQVVRAGNVSVQGFVVFGFHSFDCLLYQSHPNHHKRERIEGSTLLEIHFRKWLLRTREDGNSSVSGQLMCIGLLYQPHPRITGMEKE